jgi:hypothetical protein
MSKKNRSISWVTPGRRWFLAYLHNTWTSREYYMTFYPSHPRIIWILVYIGVGVWK